LLTNNKNKDKDTLNSDKKSSLLPLTMIESSLINGRNISAVLATEIAAED